MIFSQSFIFRCLETVPAVEFSENSTVDALQYLGDDREVHQLLDDDANYYIQKEGCQIEPTGSNSTIFTITASGSRLNVLPVRDFAIGNFSDDVQNFGMKIGPVCFC